MKREKTYRIKTNNQELLIRKENESDATSRWIITGNEKSRFNNFFFFGSSGPTNKEEEEKEKGNLDFSNYNNYYIIFFLKELPFPSSGMGDPFLSSSSTFFQCSSRA